MQVRGWSRRRISLWVLNASSIGALTVSVAACDSSGNSSARNDGSVTHITNRATVPSSDSYFKNDNDRGDNDSVKGDEQELLTEYGIRPPASEYDAIATTIRRYMSVALAENGTAACPMLYASFRNALLELHHSVRGSCPALMAMEFRRHHSQLTSYELSRMVIADTHVKNGFGVAVLAFKAAPERDILIAREGSSWKIDSILDSELP